MSIVKDLRLREPFKWSQEKLAEMAGTSQPQINRLEKNERKLTKEWAIRLAKPLEVSPVRILFPETDYKSDADLAVMIEKLSRLNPDERATIFEVIRPYLDEHLDN